MANPDDEGNRRGALIGLGVIVLIFVVSWLVFRALHNSSRMEDCLMSGRSNCAPIDNPQR